MPKASVSGYGLLLSKKKKKNDYSVGGEAGEGEGRGVRSPPGKNFEWC